jgi:glycosyltransferase involved in cell wall biosynthesis
MPARDGVTFAVATYGTGEILEDNFLASPCLQGSNSHEILIQKDYESAAKAYNNAIERSHNDLMVFAQQDMVFPEPWLSQLDQAIDYLDSADPGWGPLGCYGRARDGVGRGYLYSPGRGLIGSPFEAPAPIQTLDEIVLIFRKSSGLRFDDSLPHFHLYGTDICLSAEKMGMKSYAIPAFCIHNAHQYVVLPREFYASCAHIKRVWKDYLPIETTCLRITRSNIPMYRRRLREAYLEHIRHKGFIAPRAKDVPELLHQAAIAVMALEQ